MTKTISKAQLAREMLEKAVSEWQKLPDKPEGMDFFISDIDGEIGIGLEFKTAYGPTTIIFNPQETVEELVGACQRRLERLGLWEHERLRERILRTQVRGSIAMMLAVVRSHFEDSIWELPLVVTASYDWMIAPPALRRQLFDDLLDQINQRKRRRFEVKGRGRRPTITEGLVQNAIKTLGGNPSQRAVARFIGVSPKTVREWCKRHGFAQWGDFLTESRGGRK